MFRNLILALSILIVQTTPIRAEKVNMPPEQLHMIATHVITGEVTAIQAKIEEKGNWVYTWYVAEIIVSECWRRTWNGPNEMPTSTTGYRGLPHQGEFLRVYLAQNAYDGFSDDNNDGGFNVIFANGFENLDRVSMEK